MHESCQSAPPEAVKTIEILSGTKESFGSETVYQLSKSWQCQFRVTHSPALSITRISHQLVVGLVEFGICASGTGMDACRLPAEYEFNGSPCAGLENTKKTTSTQREAGNVEQTSRPGSAASDCHVSYTALETAQNFLADWICHG